MSGGKQDEIVYIWFDGFNTSMHGRDRVTLALQTDALMAEPLPHEL